MTKLFGTAEQTGRVVETLYNMGARLIFLKNIFGINITEDKTRSIREFDGQIFHKKSLSPKLADVLDEAYTFAGEIEKSLRCRYCLGLLKLFPGL